MAVFCGCSDFLVNSVCARDLSLLNSVKYDSSLISFSAPWQVKSFLNLRFIDSMQLQFSVFFFFFEFFLVMQLQFQNFPNYLVMQLQFFLPELILHQYSVEGLCLLVRRVKVTAVGDLSMLFQRMLGMMCSKYLPAGLHGCSLCLCTGCLSVCCTRGVVSKLL